MANKKISELPPASTPLTGVELVPLVQNGITSRVSVNNLKGPDGVRYFQTNATMTALTSASGRTDGAIYQVAGAAAAGDGGGGAWRYSAASVATPNVGTVLAANDGIGRYLRVDTSVLNPVQFGAVSGTGANQHTAMTALMGAASYKVVDLLGLTWRFDSTLLIPAGVTIRNGTLSFANGGDTAHCLQAYGSLGTEYTLTAAPVKGATSIAVSSNTGLAEGDWLILRSNDDFSPIDSGKKGEWVRVLSVSGLTINLEQKVRHTYTTGFTSYKPATIKDITLDSVKFIGSGNTGTKAQYAIRAYLNQNINIRNCAADKFGYACYSLETTLGGSVTNCQGSSGNFATGAAYGVSLTGGCDGVTVSGGRYSYFRHGVSVGGTFFTEYGHTITGVATDACSDAGIDVHPNCMNIVIVGNMIDCYSSDATQQGDGITAQGAGILISGNTVKGWRREGILCQPLTNAPESDDVWTIANNTLISPASTANINGITFSSEKGAGETIRALVISGNSVYQPSASSGNGITVYNTTSGGPIRTISITGNSVYCRTNAISITAVNLELIEDVAIVGNSLRTLSSATACVLLTANADVSKFLQRVLIAANVIAGGNYGVNLVNAPDRVVLGTNLIQSWTTAATNGTFAASTNNFTT